MLFSDARNYQIVFLSLFLFLGISNRDWSFRFDFMLVIIVSCLLTQIFWLWINSRNNSDLLDFNSLRSAAITSLGLCLLLRSNDYSTMAIASCLAISSKFLFRYRNKHFFNPANFGIITALIFTNDAWVSPGQWGTDWWYFLLFIATGGMIINKVGRWDTSAAFLLTFAGLEAIRNFWLGWSGDVLGHQLMSGSLLLFTFFMITDPRSIPNAQGSRLIWAISIGVLTFILRDFFFINTAMFWALFALSPLTIVLDSIWSAKRFSWIEKPVNGVNYEVI